MILKCFRNLKLNNVRIIYFILLIIIMLNSIFFIFSSQNFIKYEDFQTSKHQELIPSKHRKELELLRQYGLDPETHNDNESYVLVLGSNGLIGSVLTKRLQKKGYNTLNILSRHHRDLRIHNALDIFNDINVSFIYFLAYEVGGAKFLQTPQNQDIILHSNIEIMKTVFDWALKRQIRFAFASSSLSADNSSYGFVKRIGENITLSNPQLGRLFRLWNAYGFEYPSPKSHVIPDIISQCILYNKFTGLTTGEELRQFTHVNDVCDALIAIFEHFNETDLITDISDGKWVSLIDVSHAVSEIIPDCNITFSGKKAKYQKRHEPNLSHKFHKQIWYPKLSLKEGCKHIYDEMLAFYRNAKSTIQISFIILIKGKNSEKLNAQIKERINLLLTDFHMKVEYHYIIYNRSSFQQQSYEAINNAKGKYIIFMDSNIIPSYDHLSVFYHNILQDDIIYIANYSILNSIDDINHNELRCSYAYFHSHTTDLQQLISQRDYVFLAATKKFLLSIHGLPGKDEDKIFTTVQFQCPVYRIQE